MRLLYPGSFFKLLLLGFALAMIPLVLALVDAYLSIERLSRQSEQAITSAMQITHDSRTLNEQVTTLERIARQQLILDSAGGLDNYSDARQLFTEAYGSLSQHVNDQSIRKVLAELKQHDEAIWSLLRQTPRQVHRGALIIEHFESMVQESTQIRQYVDKHIASEIDQVKYQAAQERRTILQKLWLLVPIGLVLTIGAVLMIRMPIRQISSAIRSLGEGHLERPVTVHGPHDMEALGRQLDWLRTRLQAADAQQTRFLHHISHELKTPLTALHEGSQLLHDGIGGQLNSEQTEIVDIMQNNVSRMRKLIEDLLDYGRLRFQPPVLNRQQINLADLFKQIEQVHHLALTTHNLTLDRQDNGLNLNADQEKLTVILSNLLSNAIKFAPEHSTIEMIARRSAGGILLEVTDTGPGIPEDQTNKMFEPFIQGAASLHTAVKGSGLGLSIVRELVGAHGGEVSLLPNQPTGIRAMVRLPLRSKYD